MRDSAIVGVRIDRELGIKLALWVNEGGAGDRVILKLLLGERLTLMLDDDAFRARALTGSDVDGGTDEEASMGGSDVEGSVMET